MMKNINIKTRLIAALILPIAVLGGWTLSLSLNASAPTVILKVDGYDPRDLLSGHYLVYRVDYGSGNVCENQPTCLCLDGTENGVAVMTSAAQCSEMSACQNKLRGACQGEQFVAGIERFYFPESGTKKLLVVPPNSTIEVALNREGNGVVRQLFVDGDPVSDWLKKEK